MSKRNKQFDHCGAQKASVGIQEAIKSKNTEKQKKNLKKRKAGEEKANLRLREMQKVT